MFQKQEQKMIAISNRAIIEEYAIVMEGNPFIVMAPQILSDGEKAAKIASGIIWYLKQLKYKNYGKYKKITHQLNMIDKFCQRKFILLNVLEDLKIAGVTNANIPS